MPCGTIIPIMYPSFGPIPSRTQHPDPVASAWPASLPQPFPSPLRGAPNEQNGFRFHLPRVSFRISRPSTRIATRYFPPPSASRAATTRIAVSYAANVMADAGALFTSPGANPL